MRQKKRKTKSSTPTIHNQLSKECTVCKSEFSKKPQFSYAQWSERKFCSNKCSNVWKYNNNIGCVQKGKDPWNKNKKGVMGPNVKGMSKNDPRITGENNYQWQGEYPSYKAVHSWVRKHFGSASLCEFCGDKDKTWFHWSNVSGEYRRDIKDWQQLCVQCHKMYDKGHLFV